ncbi:MAG TPA: MFS transporter [Candidatus Krumholzibacteriaceae bacterium]|nr:MFS transporter [Candidatus Krumholzibacteriaceae bacterium]
MTSLIRVPDGFDRDIRLLTSSMFTRRIVTGFLQVVRAIYFALLGYTAMEIGLLLSLATFVSALHSVTFGYLCDRYGRKPFLILGTVFATLRMVVFALSTDFWMLALGQGLGAMGEGEGAGQPVVSGYITDKTEATQRPGIYSAMAITNGLAASIGSAFGGLPVYLQDIYGFNVVEAHQLLWWACAVGSALSIVFLFPIREPRRRTSRGGEAKKGGKVRNWGVILRFSLVRSTSGLGWGMIESLMTLYLFYRFGVGSDALGPIYSLSRFLSIFTYLLIPRMVGRFGDINTIIGSRIAAAVLTTAFALSNAYPVAMAVLVINRIVVMFTMPIRQTLASGMVDPEETATAIGVSSFARMGVRSAAPTLAGYMFEAVSLSMPFFTGAALMAVNGALYWVFFREKD